MNDYLLKNYKSLFFNEPLNKIKVKIIYLWFVLNNENKCIVLLLVHNHICEEISLVKREMIKIKKK